MVRVIISAPVSIITSCLFMCLVIHYIYHVWFPTCQNLMWQDSPFFTEFWNMNSSFWYTDPLRQQLFIIMWLAAMETLSPWQQKPAFVTLLFEGIWTPYLLPRSFEATAIHHMSCCYGNHVTMATEACISNFAVWRYMNPLFGTQILWANSFSSYHLLLWKPCCHGNRSMHL